MRFLPIPAICVWTLLSLALTITPLVSSLQPTSSLNSVRDSRATPPHESKPLAATSREKKLERMVEPAKNLPLNFEENIGQTDSHVKFSSRASGYGLFLTPAEAVIALIGPKSTVTKTDPSKSVSALVSSVKIKWVGANPKPEITGLEEQTSKSHYFIGNDPSKWRTDVPNYAKVRYEGLYPGIDMLYYGNQRQVEYDFVVSPGGDAGNIKLQFEGARKVFLDRSGNLVFVVKSGVIRQHKPVAYQEVNGVRREVKSNYYLLGKKQVGIRVGNYDRSKTLYIDPILSYSTYFGSTLNDYGRSVAVDLDNNIYVTGGTFATNFPTVNAFQSTNNGGTGIGGFPEIFITKFNPAGTQILFSTYLGGNDTDVVEGLAVDASGNIHVAGLTYSSNFPVANAFRSTRSGSTDVFVTKLSASGNSLIYSTYFGGNTSNSSEKANDIAVDNQGNAIVVGLALSTNFPVLNAYQSTPGLAGWEDGFVSRFSPTGTLTYSTFFGGSSTDSIGAVAVDPMDNIYVTGSTSSTNFPVLNAFQPTKGNVFDAFVAKLDSTGSTLLYSSYLGAGSGEGGAAIAVDSAGSAYITGSTASVAFPIVNAFQPTYNGGPSGSNSDAFVTKVHPLGTSLIYSTYLGGTHFDDGNAIAVDDAGNAYVVGQTFSSNFPVTNPIQASKAGSYDGFIAKLGHTGATLPFSSYLGGSLADDIRDVAIDSAGDLYLTGRTNSTNWPTASPYQAASAGSDDIFIAKITGLTGYSITGIVTDASGVGMSGVTVTLTGSQSGSKQTTSDGAYILDVPSGGNYTLTPSKAPFTFTPTNTTFTNLSGNQTANFTTVVYSISGRVADGQGVGLSGATLTLSGTQTGTTQTDTNGNYSFPSCAAGGSYVITPAATSYTYTYAFSPANRSYPSLSGNQTAADFAFTTSTQVAFSVVADAYVKDGTSANSNFGSATSLQVKTANQADERRDAYLKFDLGILSRPIVDAKLRIYAAVSAAGSVNTSVYSVADTGWSESGVTWANKPLRGSSALSTVAVATTSYTAYDLDVTGYVVAEKAAGRNVISLALHNPSNSTPHILVASREAATNKPQLVLTTSDTSNAAPAVSLTAPSGTPSLTAPADITVTATASDTDGTISKVDFYAGNSQIGSDSLPPYTIQWNGVGAGTYTLTAVATDNYGATASSSPLTVSVLPSNNAPTVTLTSPAEGLWFAAGSNIGLTATATDSDGTISKVDFYAGAQLVGTDTTPPYSVIWSNAAAGAYSLTAVATDNGNTSGNSNAVNVKVVWQTGLSPTADAYVRDGSAATTNFGTAPELQTQVSTTGNNRETYLKFDISTINDVASAKLRLYGRLSDSTGSNVPAIVYSVVDTSWTESGITWNTKPSVDQALLSTTISDNNGRWYEWDLTTHIQNKKLAQQSFVTLAIKNTATSSPYTLFNSREAGSTQPQLEIVSTGVRNILFVTGSSTLNTSESPLKTRMENLGFTVTVKAAGSNQNSAVKTTDADGKVAVVISSTVTPANVLAKFRHVAVPVLLWESDLLDDQGMTEATAGFFGTQTNQDALALLDATHPMATGLTSPVSVVSSASTFTWGKPNANAVQIAALTSDATRIAIFGYETQALMPGLPMPAGLPAPARRVAFFLTDANGLNLTVEGQALFDAAIKWLTAMTVAPTITTVEPTSGTVGTSVIVSGYNFGESQGSGSLRFNSANATVSSWTSTAITALVPAGATTGPLVVIVNGKASNPITFTVNVPPVDLDGDGLPDAWELQYFGNLSQGATDDPDGDTVTNLQEYLQGRNPTIGSVGDSNGGVNLRIYTPLIPVP